MGKLANDPSFANPENTAYVVVAEEEDITRILVGGGGGVGEMDQRLALRYIWSRGGLLVDVEPCSRLAKPRRLVKTAQLVLREANALIGCDRNAAVCTTVPWVITALNPCFRDKVEDINIVQPDIGKVLATNDEKPIRSHRR